MQTRDLGTIKLSRLMLGTVQFGVDYGVANSTGQPPYETARDILACAFEGGVNCLDTAASYGTSEGVLGRALEELGVTDEIAIATKVRVLADDLTPAQADAQVEASVADSLRNLRRDSLEICLFHLETNAPYMDSLRRLQDKGWIQNIGVSALSVTPAQTAIAEHPMQALQLPGSILDHRFLNAVRPVASKGDVAVFVRSLFLQGLLLMSEAEIAPPLRCVIEVRQRLETLARAAGLSLPELAVRYVLSLPGVTCAVLGVQTIEQMRDNLALFAGDDLPDDLMRAIAEAVPALPDEILDPFRWPALLKENSDA